MSLKSKFGLKSVHNCDRWHSCIQFIGRRWSFIKSSWHYPPTRHDPPPANPLDCRKHSLLHFHKKKVEVHILLLFVLCADWCSSWFLSTLQLGMQSRHRKLFNLKYNDIKFRSDFQKVVFDTFCFDRFTGPLLTLYMRARLILAGQEVKYYLRIWVITNKSISLVRVDRLIVLAAAEDVANVPIFLGRLSHCSWTSFSIYFFRWVILFHDFFSKYVFRLHKGIGNCTTLQAERTLVLNIPLRFN